MGVLTQLGVFARCQEFSNVSNDQRSRTGCRNAFAVVRRLVT